MENEPLTLFLGSIFSSSFTVNTVWLNRMLDITDHLIQQMKCFSIALVLFVLCFFCFLFRESVHLRLTNASQYYKKLDHLLGLQAV